MDVIRTDGSIGVRRYRPEDVAPFFDAAHESALDINPWMEWCHPDYSFAEAREAAVFEFEDVDLIRLDVLIGLENVASRRVADKIGASFEGILRHGLYVHGTPMDAAPLCAHS